MCEGKYLSTSITYCIYLKLFVPPKCDLSKEFIRMILKGEKRLLPKSAVKPVDVPAYPELSIEKMMADFGEREDVAVYLPPRVAKNR